MKTYLQKIRINSQGYDDTGCYWGVGIPLYCFQNDNWPNNRYLRAYSRNDAKQEMAFAYGEKLDYFR